MIGPPLAQDGFLRERGGDSCVADNGFCPQWIADNFDRYVDPFFEHVYLTVVPVAIGFLIALAMGLLAHRRRALIGPLNGFTTALYTIPSPAMLLLLLPVTGRGNTTALVALTAYTQVIIFRNVINGLSNVPAEMVDAAAGMGMTGRQRLFRVEVPLALPEILAGVRIAAATTVGLAAFAYLAGAGGLGAQIDAQITFKSNVVVAGGLATLLAAALDLGVLGVQRALTPWRRAAVG
ncbi:MAG: ABC transporter permease [Solirubrobacterales bacterium]|nr:ABC transporter permease [Solirubrobacterales bacterium]